MTTLSRILLSSELVLDLLQDKKIPPGFKDNQVLEAKVVQVLPQGKAQLRIEGQLVDVKTRVPLSENDTLILKVITTGDTQVLKLVEAHKPVIQPPGLADMRALGPEGPHGVLARLINTLSEQPAGQPAPPNAQTQAPAAAGKGQDALRVSAGPPWATVPTPPGPAQASPPATGPPTLTALIKSEAIPFALKLAAFIIGDATPQTPMPVSVLESLYARLGTQHAAIDADPVFLSAPPGNPATPMQRLEHRTQALINTLNPADKALLTQALGDRSTGLGEKIQRLMASRPEAMRQEKGFAEIGEALIRAFPTKASPPETMPFRPASASVPAAPHAAEIAAFTNKSVFIQLKNLIHTMALAPDGPFDQSSMRNLVKNSGLMWENKIRLFTQALQTAQGKLADSTEALPRVADDVKALSMKLAESVETGGKETVESLKRFVDSLDNMQLLNRHSADEAGRYLLPLPFFSGESLKFGQLFIDLDKKQGPEKKNEGDRMVRVAFLLEMSRLGHIQADVAIFRKSLSGEILVESTRARDDIEQALPEFKTDLARKGYTVTRLECRITDSAVLSRSSLTERMIDPDGGSVNILI